MQHSSLTKEEIRQILQGGGPLLALGVSGMGMRALAALLCDLGHTVVGYDRAADATVDARVRLIDDPSTLTLSDYSLVFYTLAMGEEWEGLLCEIPHASRAQVLGALMGDFSHSIAVAGSHGKSTVTALLSHIYEVAGRAPTTVSGAVLPSGDTYLGGSRDILLLEACEYKRSFCYFAPSVYLYLNLELDHTDCYESVEKIVEAFVEAGRGTDCIFLNADDKNLKIVKNTMQKRIVLFGEDENCDYRAVFLPAQNGVHPFELFHNGERLCRVVPRLFGAHGARNTLAALAVALEEGIEPSVALGAIDTFRSLGRRLEFLGTLGAHPVYYDYAHHPTELEATLTTVRELWGRDATAVFTPHTYTRTRDLWEGFVSALRLARRALLLPIFPAREPPIAGVTSEALARAIGQRARVLSHPWELPSFLGDGEPVVLLGAGDVSALLSDITSSSDFTPKKEPKRK